MILSFQTNFKVRGWKAKHMLRAGRAYFTTQEGLSCYLIHEDIGDQQNQGFSQETSQSIHYI